MNMLRRAFTAAATLLHVPSRVAAQARSEEQAGKQLRQMVLTIKAKDLGLASSATYPRVFGVVMDWPVGAQVATVVALADGTASLYTTSTFGIIGGQAHESVRRAGAAFIGVAERHFNEAAPTSDFPYPARDRIFFYLLCYDGPRVISAALDSTQAGTGKHVPLFSAGQELLAELRKTSGR